MLAYVTGGVSVTELAIKRTHTLSVSNAVIASVTTDNWSGSATDVGVVLGVGLQYALSDRISLGLEYLHTEYASSDLTTTFATSNCLTTAGGTNCRTNGGVTNAMEQYRTDALRFVVNYKFGDHCCAAPLK